VLPNSLIPLEKKKKKSFLILLYSSPLEMCLLKISQLQHEVHEVILSLLLYWEVLLIFLSTQNVNRLNCTTMNNSNLLWSVPICFCHYSLIENLERRGLTKIENFSLAVTTLLWSSYVLNLWIWSYRKDGQK